MSVTKTSSSLAALVLASGLATAFVQPGEDAARGGVPAPVAADCLRCHEELEEVLEREVPHEPAYSEDCELCHASHAARYPKMLNLRERALCSTCHRDAVLSFLSGSTHTPVKEGQCVVCHEVHGSDHESLLVTPGSELCFTCHEQKKIQKELPSVHEPFLDGECSDCHQAHGSEFENQLVGPANSLCGLCHPPADAALVEAHYDIPVQGTQCTRCHDPHASTQSGLLLPIAHEPFAEGSCEMCHLVESDTPRLVRATGGRLCQVCHQGYPRDGHEYVHAPVAEGNCAACHEPHASRTDGLLVATQRETCTSCHAEIEERAANSRSAHPLSFDDGSSCRACHQAHSSNERDLMNSGAIRTCLDCHETQRHGHPLGADRLDPRTGEGITCVTCHDPHGTEFPMQMRGDQSRGLCLECHSPSGDSER